MTTAAWQLRSGPVRIPVRWAYAQLRWEWDRGHRKRQLLRHSTNRLASCPHDLPNRVPPRPVSAQEERNALTLPPALYDQALHLLRESPDGVPPPRGFSLPREPAADGGPLAREEAANAVREALRPLPDGLSGLHRRFVRLGIRVGHGRQIRSAVAEMPLPAEQLDAARALGRQLTRSGTTVATVTAGVALLRRCGEPEDVPYLSVLGLFREFNRAAVEALDILDRPSAAVVWLALYGRDEGLQPLIRALRKGNRQAVHTALVAYPASPRHVSSVVARRVAEACRLRQTCSTTTVAIRTCSPGRAGCSSGSGPRTRTRRACAPTVTRCGSTTASSREPTCCRPRSTTPPCCCLSP